MAVDSPKFVSAHDLQAQVNELTKRVTALEATSSLSTPATDDLDAAKAKIDAEQPGLTGANNDQMVVDEAASEAAADPGEAQSDATGAEDCSITIPGGPISYDVPPEMAFVSTRGAADPQADPDELPTA